MEKEIEVRKVETPTGRTFWLVAIDGYCAVFDFEQAAHNFAGAINRRLLCRESSI